MPSPSEASLPLLRAHLDESAAHFENAISHLDDSLLKYRPSPECWSAADCAEHIIIVERAVGRRLLKLVDWVVEEYDAARSAHKDGLVLATRHAIVRVAAPAAIQPSGRYQTSTEITKDFREARQQLLEILHEHSEWLRGRFFEHPLLKKLDGYQWLLFCAAHTLRHMAQIEEIKARAAAR